MEVAAENHASVSHGKKTIERDILYKDKKIAPMVEMIKYRMIMDGYQLPPFTDDTYSERRSDSFSEGRKKQAETLKQKVI
jgi:hypothetical protein